MNDSTMTDEKYITIKELAELKGVSARAIRLSRGKYITQDIIVKGGKSFEILLSSIEPELQDKYYSKIVPTYEIKKLPAPTDFHKPDKAKVIALARLDLLNLWKKERKNQQNKTQFDNDFLGAYNAQVLYPEIYAKLGNVSIGTLQRWKRFIVAYILKNYPNKKDLSKARVTKMVYLVDWRAAFDLGSQATDIQWYFDNYGPFVYTINDMVEEMSIFEKIRTNNFYGSDKTIYKLVDQDYIINLSDELIKIIDTVIEKTKNMSWTNFINFIYSTYPIVTSNRYTHLNLVEKAQQYKIELEKEAIN